MDLTFRGGSPSPEEVRAVRIALKLTQQACADLVHVTRPTWARYEAETSANNMRTMHPSMWELFLIKVAIHQ